MALQRISPYWQLLRPRTLPLAVAAMVCAAGLAYQAGHVNWVVFGLSLLTAIGLQMVSNIANDYGDGLRGTDQARATDAPLRITATGALSVATVRRCLYGMVLLTTAAGVGLLATALPRWQDILMFVLLGAVSITAALAYTLGRHAYGYRAMGELAVLVFFGWLAVGGSFYLHTHQWPTWQWLPATGCGLLAAAVLHINNVRDLYTDQQAGKRTLAGYAGFEGSKWLHTGLLLCALTSYALYGLRVPASFLWLAALPLVVQHLRRMWQAPTVATIGKELPAMVKIHAGINGLFALGLSLTGSL